MKSITLGLAILATATLAACGNGTPSKGELARLAENHLKKEGCVSLRIGSRIPSSYTDTGSLGELPAVQGHEALVSAGLLTVSSSERRHLFGTSKIRTYDLTEAGQKDYFQDESSYKNVGYFCIADGLKLDSISNFTTPTENSLLGMTVSTVIFTASPINIREWAKDEQLQAAIPEIGKALAEGREKKMTVALTDNGWVDVDSL